MNKIRECREQELRCRQRAMYDPAQSWKWLAEAEMWEHKAHQYRASLVEQRTRQIPTTNRFPTSPRRAEVPVRRIRRTP